MSKQHRFWQWKTQALTNQEGKEQTESILYLNGTIAEESWFDDEITPRLFKSELQQHQGDITVWINSPGGDCIAAAQIYNLLIDHKGEVTVKIDGIAASAASVIAMAGTKVLMSPVSMVMIHNPMTVAFGNKEQMKQAIAMLEEVKESIMNAYEIKTGQPREKLSKMMDSETWMNVHTAMELGFCDGILSREDNQVEIPTIGNLYSKVSVENSLRDKIAKKCHIPKETHTTKSIDLLNRLNLIKNWR